ncbi:MAG: hypothetical protein JXB85_12935 [Anaerolineales bacterium]|nr:hypothetical protein [Anaerolineales bacterium]
MKRRWLWVALPGLAVLVLLANALRGTVGAVIILPLARLFWLVRGYYGSLQQSSYWILLMMAVTMIGLFSFRLFDWGLGPRSGKADPDQGEVQQLAFWIARARHGVYPRWRVARILADLALDILERKGGPARHDQLLTGSGWDPPQEIQEYLEAALRLSPAHFSRYVTSSESVHLDQDIDLVIAYLESLMENSHDHTHS